MSTINRTLVVVVQVGGLLAALVAFVNKIWLERQPGTLREHLSQAGDVMGWAIVVVVLATIWGALSRSLIPRLWTRARERLEGSSVDPATLAELERVNVERSLMRLKAPFEGDDEAQERLRWLARNYEQRRIDRAFPRTDLEKVNPL